MGLTLRRATVERRHMLDRRQIRIPSGTGPSRDTNFVSTRTALAIGRSQAMAAEDVEMDFDQYVIACVLLRQRKNFCGVFRMSDRATPRAPASPRSLPASIAR